MNISTNFIGISIIRGGVINHAKHYKEDCMSGYMLSARKADILPNDDDF